MAPNQSITCNRRVIFYMRSSIECVCCFQKPIFGFRRPYCWTMCAFSHSGVCFAVFILFLLLSSDALVLLQILEDAKMLAFWMGLPEFFFFYMVVFVWRRKKKRSLFYTQIRCKKEKKKSSSKKLVFHYPLTQRNLSFAIIVICSTFVNTMFLINVHRHECQYNCKRF